MAPTRQSVRRSVSALRARRVLVALATCALALWLPSAKETTLLAAISVSAVAPSGASAGVSVQITGLGFDSTAGNNSITLTPTSGSPVTVAADSIVTLDASKGLRRIGFKVPLGLPVGSTAIRVINTVTGESAAGATLQIVDISLPDAKSAARGTQGLAVRVNGSANTQFVAGRTTVTFGAGVTVSATQIVSPTSLIATVSVSATTPLGGRTVTVVSPNQTAQLPSGFTVTGTIVDAPPTANAGPDQTVALGSTVTLNGTASTDPEGHPLTYVWSFVSKPDGSSSTLSDPAAVTPTLLIDRAGTYELRLVVNDGTLSSTPDTVRISTLNSRPIANAGPDQTTTVGGTVRLDGTQSSDPDGDPLTFAWSFQSVPGGSTPILSNPVGVAPSFIADRFGEYVIQLVVSDGALSSVSDTVKLSTLNSAPVANAGPDQTAFVGNSVGLSGNGSHDVDGNALTFSWSFTSKPPGSVASLSDSHSVSPSFVVDAPGTYVAQLIVNDGTIDSPADTISVTTLNSPPVANAGADQAATRGDLVHLNGAASTDVDGNPLTYAWSLTTRPAGSAATLSDPTAVNPTFTVDRSGGYTAQLIVNDGTVDSTPDVVIISTENQRPVANAGSNQTVAVGASAQLDGSGSSDPNGDAITFKWSIISKPLGSSAALSNATIVNPTFVADISGEYVAQLIVNDGEVDGTPASVTISTQNSRPAANAGPDQTVITGSTVHLDGRASADPDGTPLGYSWSLLSRPAGSAATLSQSATSSPSFVADLAGAYVAQLIVSDGTLFSDPDTVTVQVGDGADLGVTFEIPPLLTPAIGSTEAFSLRVDNLGPSNVTGVSVRFKLPGGYVPVFVPPEYDAATGIWTVGSMVRGQFNRLAISARVQATGPYDVTAAVASSSQPDPDDRNDSVSASIVPNRNADLGLSFEIAPSLTPPIASREAFFLRLDNFGPSEATGVTARFTLPAGYTLTDTQADYDNATGIWTIGTLATGSFRRLALSPLVRATGPYDVAATITASSQPDPDASNNAIASVITPNRNADMSIEFVDRPIGDLAPGKNVGFFVQVQNNGPASTSGIVAQFSIPPGYRNILGGAQVGTYDLGTGVWTIGAIPAGGLARLILSGIVNDTGFTGLTASVVSDQPDPNLANNSVTFPPINRPPAINAGPDQAATTNILVNLDGTSSSDPENDAVSYSWTFLLRPANSTATLAASLTTRPSFVPDQPGRYIAQLSGTDSHGVAGPPDTVTINVSLGDRAPAIISPPLKVANVDQAFRYDVEAIDLDAGDVLTFSLDTFPVGMSIDPASGLITWTPSEAEAGAQSVLVRVRDTGGLFATQAFTIQVSSPSNHAPAAVDDAYDVRLDESLSVTGAGVLGNDSDADHASLTAKLLTGPANGALNFSQDGSFTYTPHLLRDNDIVQLENVNLTTRVPGVVIQGSDSGFGNGAKLAADDNPSTSWRANLFPIPHIDVVFPSSVTVTNLQVVGNRDPQLTPLQMRPRAGVVQLFDANGSELFTSGPIDLPAPFGDADIKVPPVSGVQRAVLTITENERGDTFSEIAIAEFRVIGSATVRRPRENETNLHQLLPTQVNASSTVGFNIPEAVMDDGTYTTWYAASASPGEFIELTFPVDVTVTGIETNNPGGTPDGFGSSLPILCHGTFQFFDANGTALYDTGAVATPFNDRGIGPSLFAMSVPSTSGVRRVRYTLTGCDPGNRFPVGFSEIRVLGTAPSVTTPAFVLAKKFQSLIGREAHSTPIVVNLTDDNHDGRIDDNDIPDILVPVESTTNQLTGEIKAISGDDGRELFTAGAGLVSPWSELAAADLDGSGSPTIVAVHSDGNHLIAFDRTGSVKWISDANPMPRFSLGNSALIGGGISIANLTGSERPHIIVGSSVFDADGRLLGDGRALGGTTGGIGRRSALSAVGDVDLDGTPEIIAGPTAYRLVNGQLTKVWQRTDRSDGYVAIANFDDDPAAEIVVVGGGGVYMLNHDGTDAPVWNPPTHGPVPIPGGGDGGSPLVVDVDGDGTPEIGVAGQTLYTLFNRDGSVKWQHAISDRSSHSTGSIAFDLDGDGRVEIIYRDEQYLRVFRGSDGVLLAKRLVGSATWGEEPVVADVDNDGHAEIVVSSDRFLQNPGDTGVIVFEDIADKWTRTRRIWNQHSYHVTNVNENATIPVHESPHWLVPSLNSFRTNAVVPGESADGVDSFTYTASDGVLESNVATVRIAVRTPNSAPQFTSTPITTAASGVVYSYAAQASDPDAGDVFTFSLPTAPAGMTIDANFGVIQWTPSPSQLGPQPVVVKVTDTHGLFVLQSYTVQVGTPVPVPVVIGQSQPDATSAIVAAGFTLGTVSTQTHPVAPEGSVFSQTPAGATLAAPGSPINIIVSLGRAVGDFDNDHDGFTANQGDCDDGSASVHPGAHDVPGNGIDEDCSGADAINPGGIDADHDGFTPLQGDCNDLSAIIHPGAADVPGNGVDEDCNGVDAVAGDTDFPTASITSPADDAVVPLPVDIVGTASDANVLRYQLQLTRIDATTSTVIGAGATSVVNGVLGRLDPTLLENGLYRVRLVVEDANAHVSFDDRVYRVDGAKVGHTRLSFVDLEVPVAGVPITVVRTYDSRVQEQRDFGLGWSLQVRQGSYQHNREPGTGWQIVKATGPFGLPCQVVHETLFHVTQVWLSDREVYTFKLDLGNSAAVVGGCVADAHFSFVSGTTPGAKLEILGNTQVIYTSGGDVRGFDGDEDTGLVYNPTQVRLTTRDGRVIDFERGVGITRIADANGNSLSITPGGLVHSSGKSVAFQRDSQGRITTITDPAGLSLRYAYDSQGELSTFTSRAGDVVTYSYSPEQRLETIRNSLGTVLFRAEYENDGRLAGTVDADGARLGITYDLAGTTTTVTGRTGQTATYEYDPRGNVTREVDTLGHATALTYGPFDTLLSTVDAQGHTTTSTYDDQGNLLTTTDPLGHTSSYTYDAGGRVLSATDPLGHTSRNTYDARGNLLTKTDADGRTWSFTYDTQGNQTSQIDPAGNASTFTYDAVGLLVAEGTSCGGDTRYEYDADGRRVRSIVSRTASPGSTQQVVSRYEYDGEGRPIRTIYDDGYSVTREFDAAGNVQATTDKLGRRTTYRYTATGLLSSVTFPDGGTKTYTYDADGRQTGSTDEAGRTTTLAYDALGRLVRTIAPDGSTTEQSYDEIGRMIGEKDELGHTTTYGFDAAGGQVSMTDSLGQVTHYTLDASARVLSETRPDGKTRGYEYDALNRRSRVVFPDGTSVRVAYDFASRPLSATDQVGLVTRFVYDACGRLTSVIDPLGHTTSYGYDEIGQRTTQTDPAGHVTRWEYDAFHRVTRHTLPQGSAESFVYDPVGNITAHTDFNGQTTRFAYDASNRVLAKTFPDGTSEAFTYSLRGERLTATDARGTTRYEYDAIGQLTRRVDPDGTAIAYTYDAAKNRTSVTVPSGTTSFTYDEVNRLLDVIDPAGGATHYSYDVVGNLLATIYPNHTQTVRSYDNVDRPVRLENRRPDGSVMSGFTYTMGPAGNRLSVAEDTGRSTTYSYDNLYRLTQERTTETGKPDRTTSYAYDLNGNRTSKVDSATGVTSYVYDLNDRLLTENGQIYTYDANGNQLTRPDGARFVYDFENRLVRGDTPAGIVRNTFDVDGVRVRTDADGAITNYVVDTNMPFSQVLEERDGSGALKAQNVFGLDLIQRTQGSQRSYFHSDAQNSVRQLSDAAGVASDGYNYDAFGTLLSHTGTSTNPYLFAGERFDAPLGAYDLRARYYDPRIGRFSSSDPAEPDWTDPRSVNRYVYSFNDPINRRDPSGQFGLAEVMISVSINGILAQVAQPGVVPAEAPILSLDYSEIDGYHDPYQFYSDTFRSRTEATQAVRANFSAYNVRVLTWGAVAHKAGLDAVRGLKDKTIQTVLYEIPGCDGAWGCAPLNGSVGQAFFQALIINVRPRDLRTEGRWRGNPDAGLGILLGLTISHEAGHTYGIDHSHSGIMNGDATLRQRLHLNWWDEKAKARLKDQLGLKHP